MQQPHGLLNRLAPLNLLFRGAIILLASLALAPSVVRASLADGQPYAVSVDSRGFVIDGEYRILRGGSLQWFRLPQAAWRDRLKRFRAAGFNTIDLYVPWNVIEPEEGVFNFSDPNLPLFLDLARQEGLFVYFRPGPYITNEMDGGGVPGWLMDRTTKKSRAADGLANLRTDDPDFLAYVERYFGRLNDVIRPFLASNGGPIILYSVENEYNWFETFHEVDKLFWHEGGPERALGAVVPTRAYLSALRDIVTNDAIDVPITTCPGDGKTSGMAATPGIIPMPNVYNGLGGEMPEKVAYDLLKDMHDPANYGGAYANFPSGTTETDRDPARIKRMIMGGFDGTFAFNVVGMHTEGYRNSVVLAVNAGNWQQTVFDFSNIDNIISLFLSPTVGYFHNVIDYDGAISPSGGHREKFYTFRRDNLFFDAVEPYLAPVSQATRSGTVNGADPRLVINSPSLGAVEGSDRIHYWLDAGNGTAFINLVNATGSEQVLPAHSINIDGTTFPRFSSLTAPVEGYAGPGQFGDTDTTSSAVLAVGLPLASGGRLAFTSSELLTLRDFNGDTLLVVYGAAGSTGELQLEQTGGVATVLHADAGVTVNQNDGVFNASYPHSANRHLVLETANGETVRVVITTRAEAGRFWFPHVNGEDLVVAGADYIDNDSISASASGFSFTLDYDETPRELLVMSSRPFVANSALVTQQGWNATTAAATYLKDTYVARPSLPTLLTDGKVKRDTDEARENYVTGAGWRSWQGDPRTLEANDIGTGHAWYRAELELSGWNWLPFWEPTDLYVPHASDIVGIYVNGTYLATMNPLGTEIDSNSWNNDYTFPDLRPYLKKGTNVIAFRTEVWGHGSFMWPRGNLSGTTMKIPGLGFDSEKGLWGDAKVGWRDLDNWSVRADLGGQRANYQQPGFDDSTWASASLPGALQKGDVLWYRSRFDAADLPDADSLHAPVVLRLKGQRAKATIYVNGKLIGRWLSDDEWLSRGFWGRARRDMWMNTSPDEFPLARETLNPPGQDNVVAIVLEDASHSSEAAGVISDIGIDYARENAGNDAIKGRKALNFSWQ
ncbi:MAG: beta-galactosidase [Alcanivoracaceae bacterium]|nr:beta-galactosidase [Alcanivoracaceae bacterium]